MAKTVNFTDIPRPTGLTCTAISGGTLAANTTYYYTVIGVFAKGVASYVFQGKSLPSNEATGRTTTINKSITLTFSIPKGSAFTYRIYRNTTPIGTTYKNLNTLATFPTDALNNVDGIVTWTDNGVAVSGNAFFEPYTHGKLVLAGSTISDKFSIVDLYNADVANGWGVIQQVNSNTYLCNTHIVLNPNNYWYDQKKTIIFADGITATSANLEFGNINGEKTFGGCNIDITTCWLSNFNVSNLNAYRTIFRYVSPFALNNTGLQFSSGVVRDCQVDYFRNFVPLSSINCTIRNFTCSNFDNLFSAGASIFRNLNLMTGSRVFQTGTGTIIYAKGITSVGTGLGLYIGLNSQLTVVDSTYDNIGSCNIDSTGTWIRDKFSYNLKVTNASGTSINGANVKIYDKFNNLLCDVNTDLNGNIVEQELLRKQWDVVNKTITGTDYFPHKTVISATGFDDYVEYNSYSNSLPVIKSVALTETQPSKPQITSVNITQPTAVNNDGQIVITATGGTGTLEYSIDGLVYQSGNTFSDLSGDTYNISVRDTLDLLDTISGITLTAPEFLKPVITSLDLTNPSVNLNNGIIEINATGGTTPYMYSLNNSIYQSGNSFNNLSGGTYTINIKDFNNQTDSVSGVELTTPSPIIPKIDSIVITDSKSTIESTGGLKFNISSGTAPYMYKLNDGNYQTSNIFTGLPAGIYTITIKDSLNQLNSLSGIKVGAISIGGASGRGWSRRKYAPEVNVRNISIKDKDNDLKEEIKIRVTL